MSGIDSEAADAEEKALVLHALVDDFAKMVNNSEFSDVLFIVEGQEFFGHRNILAGTFLFLITMLQ
jgi:hypothetical protein